MTNDRRRKLLKSMAMGGATVPLSQIPTSWTKPIVESTVLPAHAQTTTVVENDEPMPPSCPQQVSSTPSSLTVAALIGAPGDDEDGINLFFDGCSDLTMAAGDEPSTSGNRLLFIDADSSQADVFDIEATVGSNWTLVSSDLPGSFPPDTSASNLPEGTYQLTIERQSGPQSGTQFEIDLTIEVVEVSGPDGVEMTVSGLTATVI